MYVIITFFRKNPFISYLRVRVLTKPVASAAKFAQEQVNIPIVYVCVFSDKALTGEQARYDDLLPALVSRWTPSFKTNKLWILKLNK